jgi:hypothetical protein
MSIECIINAKIDAEKEENKNYRKSRDESERIVSISKKTE